jgi:hypothetical protein
MFRFGDHLPRRKKQTYRKKKSNHPHDHSNGTTVNFGNIIPY